MISLHFAADELRKRFFSAKVCIGRSRSSKVIDFCTKRKHVCDFLLVCHSYLSPISHRLKDIAGFCAHSTLILGVVPLD